MRMNKRCEGYLTVYLNLHMEMDYRYQHFPYLCSLNTAPPIINTLFW